jgi:tol-pal system protein YbgF
MMRSNKGFVIVSAAVLIFGLTLPAMAQGYGLPPADVGRGTQDEASLLVRVERLENQLRQMNGQIEQVQFENHRLEEQLKKFQQDVEFRFQESGRAKPPQKRGELDTNAQTQTALRSNEDPGSPTTPPTVPPRSNRRADAFDPDADPNAPGAPRVLGGVATTSPSTIRPTQPPNSSVEVDEGNADVPLELSSSPAKAPRPPALPPEGPVTGQIPPNAAVPLRTPGGTIIANAQPNSPPVNPVKEEFDLALGYLKQKEYETAEKSFSAFLQKNPKTRYSAEAVYYLGESYYLRGRQREAAEQYLKISSDFPNSSRAPEALLRLGQSLHALGAKEQACASFSEVSRKYPNASAAVKAAAEREAKRVQC